MALKDELGFPNAFQNRAHEALLNIVVTSGLITKEGDRILRPFGLTDSQFNVMMVLRHQCEGGDISQTVLGDRLVVNRSNVTGLIDRMEKAGWVARTDDPGDRRVKRISLTASGKRLLDKVEKIYIERVEEVMGNLSREEWTTLCQMLERVRRPLWGAVKDR